MAKTWNIVRDYDWTSAPKNSEYRKSAPRVWLTEYKIKSNDILTMLGGYVSIVKSFGNGDEFYDNMYKKSTERGDDYRFPYFNDSMNEFSNSFGDTFQNGIGGGGGIGETLKNEINAAMGVTAQIAVGVNNASDIASNSAQQSTSSPGSYVETPMFYEYGKNASSLQISFVLSNTINSEARTKNQEFIKHFTKINKPLRTSGISVEPPRIYNVRVYGHRYIRWAYCDSFSTKMIGSRKMIDGVITPEAYEITVSMKSLTMEHAGFMDRA